MKWRRRRLRVRISTVIFDSVPHAGHKVRVVDCSGVCGYFLQRGSSQKRSTHQNDGGGDIPQYIAKYLYLQLSGEGVLIDGDCLSACTLALGLLAQDRRCFTNKARLGFHAAWEESGTLRIRHPLGTDVFWLVYPPEIRRWITRHGGPSSMKIFPAATAAPATFTPANAPTTDLTRRSA